MFALQSQDFVLRSKSFKFTTPTLIKETYHFHFLLIVHYIEGIIYGTFIDEMLKSITCGPANIRTSIKIVQLPSGDENTHGIDISNLFDGYSNRLCSNQ